MIELLPAKAATAALSTRELRARIDGDVYRDGTVEVPLPTSHHSLAELENPDAVRRGLEEEQETLRRCEAVLKAIDDKEKLQVELQTKEGQTDCLFRRLIGWEGLQKAKAELPQLRKELQQIEVGLETATAQIAELEKSLAAAGNNKIKTDRLKVEEENQFNTVMGRFNECAEAEWIKSVTPDEAIPDDFDASVALFLASLTDAGSALAWGFLKPLSAILFIVFFIGQLLYKEVVKYDLERYSWLASAKTEPTVTPMSSRVSSSPQTRPNTPALAAAH